jgi:ABC-2 type transport system ATP-binding protein
MRSLIGSLARSERPVTVLLTSHNLAEVEELCERVAVISRGRIRAVDTPDKIRAAHRSRERVRLSLRGLTDEDARRALTSIVDGLEVNEEAGAVVVNFERDDGDDRLDRAVRSLLAAGATLVACETERGTLLDALESYEREHEHEDADVAADRKERS